MTWLDGNRKLVVSIVSLAVVGVVCTWGPMLPEQVESVMKIVVPAIIAAFAAGNAYEHKLNNSTKNGGTQ